MALAILKMTCSNFTDHTAVLSTTTTFNITSLVKEKYDYIINLHKINDIKRLDDFLNAVNSKLAVKGFFFCCVETKDQRKHRLLKKYPPLLNYIYYFFRLHCKNGYFQNLSSPGGFTFFLPAVRMLYSRVPKHWEDFPGQDSELSRSHSSETSCVLRQGSIMNPSLK